MTAVGCGGSHGGGGSGTPLRAYAASDACHHHTDTASCAADSACAWSAIETCPADAHCPGGVCGEADPCAAHADRAGCGAAGGCAWAEVGTALAACSGGRDCGGGACYTPGSGGDACLCACPAYPGNTNPYTGH
jgi:hypothetical protein